MRWARSKSAVDPVTFKLPLFEGDFLAHQAYPGLEKLFPKLTQIMVNINHRKDYIARFTSLVAVEDVARHFVAFVRCAASGGLSKIALNCATMTRQRYSHAGQDVSITPYDSGIIGTLFQDPKRREEILQHCLLEHMLQTVESTCDTIYQAVAEESTLDRSCDFAYDAFLFWLYVAPHAVDSKHKRTS